MPDDDRSLVRAPLPGNRTAITGEPEPVSGRADPRFPDVSWIGHAQEGGGHVPDDFEWTTNPKQHQDDLMGEWPERT